MIRPVGVMAAIAIAFFCITSPSRETANAKPEAKPPHDAKIYEPKENAQLQKLTDAIGTLQQSVDERLHDVETRFTSLEAPAAETMDEARLAALESRVDSLEDRFATYQPKAATTTSSGGSSGGLTVAPPAIPSVVEYSPRWNNYDGMSPTEHARVMHGIDTTGMTATQVAMLRDADHDAFGAGHPPAMRARSRTTTVMAPSNCPGGVCPAPSVSRSTTVSSRGGLLGFGVFGRRR